MRIYKSLVAASALAFAPMAVMAQQPAPSQPGTTSPAGGELKPIPGPISSPEDLLETARLMFVLADANNDGQISKQEAMDAGNLIVGGVFFRADENGDGIITKEEADRAREQMLRQRPILRFVMDRASRDNTPEGVEAPEGGTNPEQVAQAVWNLLDSNNDGQLQASEIRQAIQTGVETVFATVDTNRDEHLTPNELNAAMYGAVQTGVQAAFQAADQDNSGTLSKEEFAQAIVQPAYTLFDILDRDLDGQLSPEEIDMAARIAIREVEKMTLDVPANSPANVLGSGRAFDGQTPSLPTQSRPGTPGAARPQPVQPGTQPSVPR